jgi:hypothetical protein
MKLIHLLIAMLPALLVPANPAGAADASGDDSVEAAIHAQYAYQPPRADRGEHPALTVDERSEFIAWLRERNGKGNVAVNPADPRQLRMLELFHKAARRPLASHLLSALGGVDALRAKFESCETFLKVHQANAVFMDVGTIDGNKLTAATLQAAFLGANPQDVKDFGTVLVVLDSDGKDVTEASDLSHKGETILLTEAPPAEGKIDQEHPPEAGALFTVFMDDNTPCQFTQSAEVLPPPKSINVTAPNNPQNRKTVICINRANPEPGWPQPCDFGPFPQGTISPVSVVVPLAGTIMLPLPLALKNGKVDAVLRVTAINSQDGATCEGQNNNLGDKVLALTTATGDNQGVTWSILNANALIFGNACYQPHSGLAFNMYWNIKVTKPDGKPSTVTAIVSNNVLLRPSANTLVVRGVDLQWGCLPTGTLVTLADRTSKPIEDISPHDLVLGPDGKPWEPVGKLSGEEAELVVVTTEDGTVARMTGEHPVIIGTDEQGRPRWTAASHLSAGTSLVTAKGPSKVSAVERHPYGGKVYNIALRPQGSTQTPKRGASFYADGLLVGDQTMQGLDEPGLALAGPSPTTAN